MQKRRKFFAVFAKVVRRKAETKRTHKILIKRIENIDANKTAVDQCRDYVSSNITKKIVRRGKRTLLLSSLTNLPRNQIAKEKSMLKYISVKKEIGHTFIKSLRALQKSEKGQRNCF